MRKSTHLVGVPSSSSDSDPDYFNEFGEPVYVQTHLVHAKEIHRKKHLIQFPISVNLEKVRKPAEGPCPTVWLKANTGVDVNLLNSTTFDRIIGDRSILQPSTYKMEAYGNSTVAVFGKFFAFLRWKGKIYRQLFFMTTANASPNLLSRDGCYTLGVLKPCYSVETLKTSKSSSTQPTTDLEQHQMHGRSCHHWSDEGSGLEKQSNSTQWSFYKDHLQGDSLKKQNIIRVYSVVTTGIGKSPDDPCEFQLQPNEEIKQHAPRQVPLNLQGALHQETEIHQGNQFIAEPAKEVTECVCSLEIVDEKVPADFNTGKDHSSQKMTERPDGFLDVFQLTMKLKTYMMVQG